MRWWNRAADRLRLPLAKRASGTACDEVQCSRCGRQRARSLGLAGSHVEWFACAACGHVWTPQGVAPPRDTEQARPLVHTRVIIVDDDVSLLRGLEAVLKVYDPTTARSGAEALTLLQHYRPELLLTDYLMPDMSGGELIAEARAIHPSIKVLILTGHSDIQAHEPWLASERLLEKPCTVEQILETVAEMIGPPGARADRPRLIDGARAGLFL